MSWQLTAESATFNRSTQISEYLQRWGGVAIEFESKFGPLKVLLWIAADTNSCGVMLWESSHALGLQASDASTSELFERVGIHLAERLDASCFGLVGDPALRILEHAQVISALQVQPSAVMEPLFLKIYVLETSRAHATVLPSENRAKLTRSRILDQTRREN